MGIGGFEVKGLEFRGDGKRLTIECTGVEEFSIWSAMVTSGSLLLRPNEARAKINKIPSALYGHLVRRASDPEKKRRERSEKEKKNLQIVERPIRSGLGKLFFGRGLIRT